MFDSYYEPIELYAVVSNKGFVYADDITSYDTAEKYLKQAIREQPGKDWDIETKWV